LLGLDGGPEGFIELVSSQGLTAPGILTHRLRNGDRPRTLFVDNFRITNVERTLLDLFAVLPKSTAELALEDSLRRRLTTLDRLWNTAKAFSIPGRTGVRSFREALIARDHRDGTLQSRMEARLLSILKRAPKPQVQAQYEVNVDGEHFRIDFAYPDIKLGIEAQSLRWHHGQVRWEHDLRRDRRLKGRGWTLLYYSWNDIDLYPDRVLTEVTDIRRKLEAGPRLF
jgi:very-short-patch-repair endonuclease